MIIVGLVGIIGAVFVAVYWLYLSHKKVPDSTLKSGTLHPLDVRMIIEMVGEQITNGIRAGLGLDAVRGEVVEPKEDMEFSAPPLVKEIELDPFMRFGDELEWPNEVTQQEQPGT